MKVKLVCGWDTPENVREEFKKYTMGDYRWGDMVLCGPDETPDYYLIVNYPAHTNEQISADKVVYWQWEPDFTRRRWAQFRDPPIEAFLSCFPTTQTHNIVTWYLDADYAILKTLPIEKTKVMSGVVSNGRILDGHKDRYEFVEQYLSQLPYYDHYGRDPIPTPSYRGAIRKKEDGLFPYKYTFAAENTYEPNYFTEKIVDCILAECLAFYDGCPNIYDFFHKDALVKIDMKDPQRSLDTIRSIIEQHEWEDRLAVIRQEKHRILDEFQVMPTVEKILKNYERGIEDKILKDTTYLLGYRYAGPERENNLNALLKLLNKYFGESLEIVIIEQDSESRLNLDRVYPNVKHIFTPSKSPYNRGWAFNVGVRKTKRNVIVFGDVDIVMKKQEFYESFRECYHGVKAVDPFSKKMVDVIDQLGIDEFYKTLDIDVLEGVVRSGVGPAAGIFLMHRKVFDKIGGWDEYLEGWGCEDNVIEHKLRIMEEEIVSLPFSGFHLNHPPATRDDTTYQKNLKRLMEIEKMSRTQLQNYLYAQPERGDVYKCKPEDNSEPATQTWTW